MNTSTLEPDYAISNRTQLNLLNLGEMLKNRLPIDFRNTREKLEHFILAALSSFNFTEPRTAFNLDNDKFVALFGGLLVEIAMVSIVINSVKDPYLPEADRHLKLVLDVLMEHTKDIKSQYHLSEATDTAITKRKRYTTTKKHGKFPAGTECWASRTDDDLLLLEYDDGTKIKLKGDWYLLGNELPKRVNHPPIVSEVVEPSSSLPSILMLGGALIGGLFSAAMQNSKNEVRVLEDNTTDATTEEDEDAREDQNQTRSY